MLEKACYEKFFGNPVLTKLTKCVQSRREKVREKQCWEGVFEKFFGNPWVDKVC